VTESSSLLAALPGRVRIALRRDRPIYLMIAAYALAGAGFLAVIGEFDPSVFFVYVHGYAANALALMPAVVIGLSLLVVRFRHRHRRMLVLRMMLRPQRLARGLAGVVLVIAMAIFQGTFTAIKTALPEVTQAFATQPFFADPAFADLERAVFGGDPWQQLHALLPDSVTLMRLVELNYGVGWAIVTMLILFHFATSPRADGLRIRYFACFILTWFLLGNVFAAVGMSAGPALYGFATGDPARFADLVAALSPTGGMPFSASSFQAYLADAYRGGEGGFGTGISAFPSLHVGAMMIDALFLREIDRRLGLAAFAYTALIWVSSVYLGWHYAVDGLFSILFVAGLYAAALRAPAILATPKARPSALRPADTAPQGAVPSLR
jgi:PAP2 superfamily.